MVINMVHGTISSSSYADYLVGYVSLGDQASLRSGFTFQVMLYSDLPPIEKVDSKTLSRFLQPLGTPEVFLPQRTLLILLSLLLGHFV